VRLLLILTMLIRSFASLLATFALTLVTPNIAGAQSTIVPVSGTVNGPNIDIVFSGSLRCPNGCSVGFAVRDGVTGADLSLAGSPSSPSGTTTIRLLLHASVRPGQAVTLAYSPGTLTDDAGNPLTAFADFPLTNVTAGQVTESTEQFHITIGKVRLNRGTGHYEQTITLKNASRSSLFGPLSLVFDGLNAGVVLIGGTGSTICSTPSGSPFINVDLGSDGLIAAREQLRVETQIGFLAVLAVDSSSGGSFKAGARIRSLLPDISARPDLITAER
jgi:hypothetical protein